MDSRALLELFFFVGSYLIVDHFVGMKTGVSTKGFLNLFFLNESALTFNCVFYYISIY